MLKEFVKDIKKSINRYGSENIDICYDRCNNQIYGMFHSRNNSFNVTNGFRTRSNVTSLRSLADALHIGFCEE